MTTLHEGLPPDTALLREILHPHGLAGIRTQGPRLAKAVLYQTEPQARNGFPALFAPLTLRLVGT